MESKPRLSRRLFVPRDNLGIVRIANRHDLELTLPQFLECHELAKKSFVVVVIQIGTHRRWVVQRVAAPNSSDLGNVYRPSLPVAFFSEKLHVFIGRVDPVNVGEREQSESLSETQVLQGPGDRSGRPGRFKCLLKVPGEPAIWCARAIQAVFEVSDKRAPRRGFGFPCQAVELDLALANVPHRKWCLRTNLRACWKLVNLEEKLKDVNGGGSVVRRVASSLDLRKKQCEEKWIRCVDAAPERTLLAIHASSQQFHPPHQLSHRFDFLFFCTSTQFRVQAHTRKAVSSVIRATKPPIPSCNRTRPAEARPTPPSWPTMVDWLFTDKSMGFIPVN